MYRVLIDEQRTIDHRIPAGTVCRLRRQEIRAEMRTSRMGGLGYEPDPDRIRRGGASSAPSHTRTCYASTALPVEVLTSLHVEVRPSAVFTKHWRVFQLLPWIKQ